MSLQHEAAFFPVPARPASRGAPLRTAWRRTVLRRTAWRRTAWRRTAWRRTALEAAKRGFDLALGLALLPCLALVVAAVALANRWGNRGPLFFTQARMGRHCRPFTILKLRTMLPGDAVRGPDDPLEVDRITPFGALLRRTRLDELPQVVNVLKGDMSFVGPRPDALHHAVRFLDVVPGYRERHSVRPGITGLAQTVVGYAEGVDATARKVEADLAYIRRMSFALEARIVGRTLGVMLTGFGAR